MPKISLTGFNTASGRYCCNFSSNLHKNFVILSVSIPQAVGTVATIIEALMCDIKKDRFNTASGRYCCNAGLDMPKGALFLGFQYRKR